MTLLLVRHAHAGSRSAFEGDDRTRPLSDKGRRQSRALAKSLTPYGPDRILSSPAIRCRQTVDPLAESLDLAVISDDRLFEGPSQDAIDSLVDDVSTKKTVVLSTHGDVIPAMLESLMARGMTTDDRLVWQKASIWVVEYSKKHGWGSARYLEPPKGG